MRFPRDLLLSPCRTPDQLHDWVRLFVGLNIPRHAVCEGHDAPFDYLCAAYFEPATDLIVWAPRGGGKTRLAALATLLDLLHKPGISVRILGGSLEQSLRMWEHLVPDLERLVPDLLQSPQIRSRRLRLRNGSSCAVLTQSQRAVRGLRVQKLRCDEIELFDPEVWEAAQLVTRSARVRPPTFPRRSAAILLPSGSQPEPSPSGQYPTLASPVGPPSPPDSTAWSGQNRPSRVRAPDSGAPEMPSSSAMRSASGMRSSETGSVPVSDPHTASLDKGSSLEKGSVPVSDATAGARTASDLVARSTASSSDPACILPVDPVVPEAAAIAARGCDRTQLAKSSAPAVPAVQRCDPLQKRGQSPFLTVSEPNKRPSDSMSLNPVPADLPRAAPIAAGAGTEPPQAAPSEAPAEPEPVASPAPPPPSASGPAVGSTNAGSGLPKSGTDPVSAGGLSETGTVPVFQGIIAGCIEALSTHHRPFGLMHELLESQSLQASSTAAAGTVRARLIRWCLLDVLQRCESHRDCRSCPLWDDCHGLAKTACDGFVPIDDAIALKRRVSADCWNAEMLCRKPAVQGCVFPGFDPQVHVREPLEQTHTEAGDRWPAPTLPADAAGSTLHLAIDFGFANPFVCLWVRVTGSGPEAIVHVIDEYVQAGQTLDVHLQQIQARKHGAVAWVACDPAGSGPNDQTAASNVALLRRAGYRVRYRTSRIVDGLELIRAALRPASGTPRLYIHPRCTRLIAALRSYRYPQYGNSGARGELPLKDGVHDHLIDALRYLLINRGERKIIVSRY